ncbi:MAG: cytochrome c-type biogenesis protein CcmH [Ilumatobacteraceae bacterium]
MTKSARRILWVVAAVVAVVFLVVGSTRTSGPRTQQDRIDAISKRLACPTCQGESIYVSRASAAESVRAEIARQVSSAQRTDDEIIAYIEDRFGSSVLLVPRSDGLDAVIWILPVTLGILGVAGLGFLFVRWRREQVSTDTSSPSRRRVVVVAGLVIVAVGVGWFVANSAGQRLPGQSSSGGIEDSTASLLSQARQLNFSDPQQSIELYSQVLELNPDNVEALTYRSWLVALVAREAADDVKLLAVATSLEGLQRAIEIDPRYADAHCFMGIVKFRFAGDAQGARDALDVCEANDPPAEVAGFVDSIRAEVDAALGE